MLKYTCPECGKEFTVTGYMKYYNYKIKNQHKTTYYCSYNCQQEALKKQKKKDDGDSD